MRRALFGEFHRYTSIGTITSPFLALVCAVASLACAGRVFGNEADDMWGATGVAVPNSSGAHSSGTFQHISDGSGGTFIAYAKYAGSVYAVRLNAAGVVLWGPVMLSAPSAVCYSARLCSDGNGGALVAWVQQAGSSTLQVYVQRISASGTLQWASPVAASNAASVGNLGVAPGVQGMFLVYQANSAMYAAYINASGFLAPPGIGGLSLGATTGGYGRQPYVVPDGSGGSGVIVAWEKGSEALLIVAQNVVLAGGSSLAPAWGAGSPVSICSNNVNGVAWYPTVAQDGSGGALISWTVSSGNTQVRVQRVNSSGVVQWTANGVVLVDSAVVGGTWTLDSTTSAVAADGSGGAYVAWNDWRYASAGNANDDIYGQRLDASGVPQWMSGGTNLVLAPDYETGRQCNPAMVSDLQGGALVTIEDEGGYSWDISMVKLNAAGRAWFMWPCWDSSSANKDQLHPGVIYDASGLVPKGCIVVWTEAYQIGAQKVQIGVGSANLAQQGTAILGTESSGGVDTLVANAGTTANINDGNLSTHVDTWNNTGTDPLSYVGLLWPQPQSGPVLRLELTLATFFDGGWFGPNNLGPGAGGVLTSSYLKEPDVQVTTNGGTTWQTVPHTSDYLTALNGHALPAVAYGDPTSVKATFMLNPMATNINGIRLIGSEGGTGSSGFLGVFELAVYDFIDSDSDGMDDYWESTHGLVVGVNDAAADPDGDGLSNLQEFLHGTDPQNPDTDGDGYFDGVEVQCGSNPNDPSSIPNNLARRMDASGIMGTMNALGGTATPVYHMGTAANINDGDLTTRVDTWNGTGTDPLSYVGIVWTNTQNASIGCLRLDLATFGDGGWFGPNNMSPGPGGLLSPAYLTEPDVQVSTNGGVTWTTVAHTSDYLTALNGHQISTSGWNPTLATAIFRLNSAVSGINGIRLAGSEGGVASGGFLGVFELGTLTKIPVKLLNPKAVDISERPPVAGLQFEFDSQAGITYEIQRTRGFNPASWTTVGTTQWPEGGAGHVTVAERVSQPSSFFRVMAQ